MGKKFLDNLTDWSGTYSGKRYRVRSDDQGETIRTQTESLGYTIDKVGDSAFKIKYLTPQNEIAIGLSFKNCDQTNELVLVDTSDDTTWSLIATKKINNKVVTFQLTETEPGVPKTVVGDPSFVAFGIFQRNFV